MNYSIYDSKGIFLMLLSSPYADDASRAVELLGAAGFVEGAYDSATQWYDATSDAVRERPSQAIRLDGLRIAGVPAGATVAVDGGSHVADGTDIELSFDHPGRYAIKVSNVGQIPATGIQVVDTFDVDLGVAGVRAVTITPSNAGTCTLAVEPGGIVMVIAIRLPFTVHWFVTSPFAEL